VLAALAAPSAAAAACPTAPLSPAALTGFEHGRLGYSANNLMPTGTGLSITPAAARNGSYGLKVNAAGSAGNEWFMWPTAPKAGVVRFAIRLDALPAAGVNELFSMDTYSKSALRIGYDAGTQSLRLRLSSAAGDSAVVAGPPVVAGAWHVVDVRYSVLSGHAADWAVDGVAQPSAAIAGGVESLYYARFGTMGGGDAFTAHYDDVLISTTAGDFPVGDGAVKALRPSGTTASGSAVRDNDGTAVDPSSWARLDEVPATSTVDYLQQTSASSSSYAQIAFEDTDEPCARAVRGYATTHSQATNNASNAKLSVFDGARESVIKSGDWAANNGYSRDYSATVAPVSEWSQAALNGLVARFGYSTDVKPVPILDGVLVEYEVSRP
jgi:hypothetical protein